MSWHNEVLVQLRQRIQDERTFVEPGVRHSQTRIAHHALILQEQIKIKYSGTPLLFTVGAPVLHLYCQQVLDQGSRIQMRTKATYCIQKVWLFDITEGRRTIERGAPLQASFRQHAKRGFGPVQLGYRIIEVAAQAYIGTRAS